MGDDRNNDERQYDGARDDRRYQIDFLKIFIDKCHNNKEEEFLFPALEKAGIPLEGGPIGVMLMEHDTGRGYVEKMSEAFLEYNAGNNASHKKIIENARNYIKLLTEHIQKENEYLFDMADKYLSPDRQEELIREFDRIEDKKIGEGKYEECRNIMKEVNKIYLEKG